MVYRLSSPDAGPEGSGGAAPHKGEHLPFTRYGPMRVPGGADLISRFLRRYGEWSFLETDFVLGALSPGSRILDMGAFVGTFSLSMLRSAPRRIVAIEGNPAVYPLLSENLARNCTAEYLALHLVVGTHGVTSPVPAYAPADNLGAVSFVEQDGLGTPSVETAPEVVGLQEIRRRHGDFEFIKLDIEGAELHALQADADWLSQHTPVLWVECNESPQSLKLLEFIAGLGYEVYYCAYPSYNPDNHLRDPEPMFPVAYEAGLLAVPRGTSVKLSEWQRLRGCDLIRVRDAEHLRQCLWVTPRWGLGPWTNIPTSRLQALCSHLHRQESFDQFLKPR